MDADLAHGWTVCSLAPKLSSRVVKHSPRRHNLHFGLRPNPVTPASLSAMSAHRTPKKDRLIRLLVATAVAALLVLHAWILWRRLVDGALFEAEIVFRWLGAALLCGAAFWLHRQGVSLLRGRPAAVFWLAVIVLHAGGPAPLTDVGALAHQLPPELIVLFSVPMGLRWLGTSLDVRTVARLAAECGRTRVPRARPLLVLHYPPISRRPPPFQSL